MLLGKLEHSKLEHEATVTSETEVNVLAGHITRITFICATKLIDSSSNIDLVACQLTEEGYEAIKQQA